jgi:hypothetical protein
MSGYKAENFLAENIQRQKSDVRASLTSLNCELKENAIVYAISTIWFEKWKKFVDYNDNSIFGPRDRAVSFEIFPIAIFVCFVDDVILLTSFIHMTIIFPIATGKFISWAD